MFIILKKTILSVRFVPLRGNEPKKNGQTGSLALFFLILYTAHLLKSEINIYQKICVSYSFSQNKNTIGISYQEKFMSLFKSVRELLESCQGTLEVTNNQLEIQNPDHLKKQLIDALIYNGIFNKDVNIREFIFWLIWEAAGVLNIQLASIQELYEARKEEARNKNEYPHMIIPSIQIPGFSYYTARSVIRAAQQKNVGAFIFELTKADFDHTLQRPKEYTMNCLAAAIKEGYEGILFIQGDQFQINDRNFKQNRVAEVSLTRSLIDEAIDAGFYNIGIDTSTLIDNTIPNVNEQQFLNFALSATLTRFIREKQPEGITVSLGINIARLKEIETLLNDFRAFMNGYNETIKKVELGITVKKMNTIVIQAPLSIEANKTQAEINMDLDILEKLANLAQNDFDLAGIALNCPADVSDQLLSSLLEKDLAELKFNNIIQDIIYNHTQLPDDLKERFDEYLISTFIHEKEENETMSQFLYKVRKKGFRDFKQEFYDLEDNIKTNISKEIEDKISDLFQKLNLVDSKPLIEKWIKPVAISKPIPKTFEN